MVYVNEKGYVRFYEKEIGHVAKKDTIALKI